MRICYVLSYRAPDYIRTRSLLAALEKLPGVELCLAINSASGLHRYRETLSKVAHIHKTQRPDLYLLGFRGHELYWLLRRIAGNVPIILDAMMSPSLALAEENQYGKVGRVASHVLTPIEKRILRDARLVLTDTEAHVKAFTQRYQLPPGKVQALPVGAAEKAPMARNPGSQSRLRVLFYGSFLPLHGFDTILSACVNLQNLPLDMDFIGTSHQIEIKLQQALDQNNQLRYRARRWVPFKNLIEDVLPSADICLGGPFGNTPQAHRVITGKTLQAMAQAVPTIVGNTGNSNFFIDKHNCLIIQQEQTGALEKALSWAYSNREELSSIGLNGRELYLHKFSIDVISQRLASILESLGKV